MQKKAMICASLSEKPFFDSQTSFFRKTVFPLKKKQAFPPPVFSELPFPFRAYNTVSRSDGGAAASAELPEKGLFTYALKF